MGSMRTQQILHASLKLVTAGSSTIPRQHLTTVFHGRDDEAPMQTPSAGVGSSSIAGATFSTSITPARSSFASGGIRDEQAFETARVGLFKSLYGGLAGWPAQGPNPHCFQPVGVGGYVKQD